MAALVMAMAAAVLEAITAARALAVAALSTLWLVLLRPRRSPGRTEDPHGHRARADALESLTRGVAARLDCGRVLKADVVRLLPPSEPAAGEDRRLLLFLPGNPGLVDFYLVFLRQLFDRLGGRVTVCGVGHAGHSRGSREVEPVSYEQQIEHKIKVMLQEFPWLREPGAKVTLVGHSVGARIALEVMHRLDDKVEFERCVAVCPTVMHIAQSRNGRKMGSFLASERALRTAFAVVAAVRALAMVLPTALLHGVVKRVMARDCPGVDDYYVQHGAHLVDPHLARNALHMARDEMVQILGRDDAPVKHAIDKHARRVDFILAPEDSWCDAPLVKLMQDTFPEAKFHVCGPDVRHAFCLSHASVLEVAAAAVPA